MIEEDPPYRSTVTEPSSNKPDPLENLSEPAESKQASKQTEQKKMRFYRDSANIQNLSSPRVIDSK